MRHALSRGPPAMRIAGGPLSVSHNLPIAQSAETPILGLSIHGVQAGNALYWGPGVGLTVPKKQHSAGARLAASCWLHYSAARRAFGPARPTLLSRPARSFFTAGARNKSRAGRNSKSSTAPPRSARQRWRRCRRNKLGDGTGLPGRGGGHGFWTWWRG